MAPDLSDSSTSARAEFSGVMIVDSIASAAGKPRTLYITGAFYAGAVPLMGIFKYYNKYNHLIEPDSRFFVHTTVALFNAKDVASGAGIEVDSEEEIDIMGDIFFLSPANDASAKYPPVVRVCGQPTNIVQATASFDVDASHWISFPNRKAMFPWSGTIPDGWTHKPIPNPNSSKFVSVSGTFAGVKTVGSSKRFHVDIASVTFLGSAPLASSTPLSTPAAKGKRKAGINFDDKPAKNPRN